MTTLRLSLACLLAATSALASTEERASGGDSTSAPQQSAAPLGLGVLDIVCLGSQTSRYSPGLTFTSREVTTTATGVMSGCVSPTHPQLHSGTVVPYTGTSEQSCLLSNARFTKTVLWNTGHFSTYSARAVVNLKPDGTSVIVATGEVISGLFMGARIEQVSALPNTALTACLSDPGATEVLGPVIFTITPIP